MENVTKLKRSNSLHRNGSLKKIVPYFGLVFVVVFFGILSDGLLFRERSLNSMIHQLFPILIISCGAVFVYAQGSMDVSIGAVVGVGALTSAHIINKTDSFILAFLISICIALVFAFANSWISGKFGIMPVMVSLCMMFIGRGIVTMGTTSPPTVYADADFTFMSNPQTKAIVMVCFIIAMTYIFNFTKIGKYVKGIGGNKICTEQAGVNILKAQVFGYLTMAIGIGIASMFVLGRVGSVTRNTGNGLEMDVLLALIFGGMPLTGGSQAKIRCAVLGSIIYVVLGSGLLLSGIPPETVSFLRGIIFIIIVFLSASKSKTVLPR